MFIVLSRYTKPLEEVDRLRPDHLAWVQSQYDAGRFLVSGRRVPPEGGAIVLRAADRDEVLALLDTDPYQRNGVVEYAVHELAETSAPLASPELEAFLRRPLADPAAAA